MRKYIASVTMKDEETGKKVLTIIEREYDRKSDFYNDLRNNGYSVRFITTEEKFDEDCEKWHVKNEQSKLRHAIKHRIDKKYADKYGISVAHYRRAYKAWSDAIMDEAHVCYLSLEDFIEIYK